MRYNLMVKIDRPVLAFSLIAVAYFATLEWGIEKTAAAVVLTLAILILYKNLARHK